MKKQTLEELLKLAREGIRYNIEKNREYEEEIKELIWEFKDYRVDWERKAEPQNLEALEYLYFVFEESRHYIFGEDKMAFLMEDAINFLEYRFTKRDSLFFDYLITEEEKKREKKKAFFDQLRLEH